MVTWGEFAFQRPDLAAAGSELIRQFGVGLGFLATVRADGGPRLHPICLVITEKALYGLIIPSPKLKDIIRDGRFALHSYPGPENEDAFYVTDALRYVLTRLSAGTLSRRSSASRDAKVRRWVYPTLLPRRWWSF
ncbi:MAG: pyridoxamine 5'-phosphate oxidase [Dehalococcoidia bacterium]|nr:pyridoxamine 5'-phosphate oxidase [Dehalococcoidia bacterium]